MDFAAVAELQVLLEGAPLPNERSSLVRYATHEGATRQQLTLLRQLPERKFDNLDELAEELMCIQPQRADDVPHRPREESGDPPGGESYTQACPARGT